eukprot:TRINITY_DN7247_c1_g1_i1.p1 TRINITY_DN7247_c1_g1~~TRINITY_DN7247_c1_g1_i1.p1  ORF type:complete len:883 (+),score=341.80 TRINITY_DN7247_c1_g1_i1:141-2651(+)
MAGGERSESIKVFARLRPQDDAGGSGPPPCVRQSDKTVLFRASGKQYDFDRVFAPEVSQDEVYSAVGAPAVERVMQGYNATVFVYGQTGSGKTHTMMAPHGAQEEVLAQCLDAAHSSYEQRGIIPRAVGELLAQLAALPPHMGFDVSANYYEIYMEEFFDLLADGEPRRGAPNSPTTHGLGSHKFHGARFHIRGLGDYVDLGSCTYRDGITSAQEVLHLLRDGGRRRHTARTSMNECSSRSHCVLRLRVRQQNKASSTVKQSELNLTDLAGSERVGKTEAQGMTAQEGRKINLSLTWLGTVVREICDHRDYVHYLDSKLTRVLQNSLGGNALTSLICVMSQSSAHAEEVRSTLEFASCAQRVRNVARIGEQLNEGQLRLLVRRLQEEGARLRQQLEQSRRRSKGAHGAAQVGDAQPGWARDDVERALDAALREVGELQEQVRMLEFECAGQIDLARHHAQQREASRRQCEVELLSQNERLATLETALEARSRRCQELESEREWLQLQLRESEAQVLQHVEENADLRIRVEELQRRPPRAPDGADRSPAKPNGAAPPPEAELQRARAALHDARAATEEERAKRVHAEESLREQRDELRLLRAEVEELARGRDSLQREALEAERLRAAAERDTLLRRAEAARDEARAELAEERGELLRIVSDLRHTLGERAARSRVLEEAARAAAESPEVPEALRARLRGALQAPAPAEDDLTGGLAERLHEESAQRELLLRAEGAFVVLRCGQEDLEADAGMLREHWGAGPRGAAASWRDALVLGPRVASLEHAQRQRARHLREVLSGCEFAPEQDVERRRLVDATLQIEQSLDQLVADLDALQQPG